EHLAAGEGVAESEEKDEEDIRIMSGNPSAPGGGNKVPQKKLKLIKDKEDDDDNNDENRRKSSSEQICTKYPSQKCTEIKPKWKKTPSTLRSRVKSPSKDRKKNPKTPEGPSSVEYIKAEMQASIERAHEHSWALLVN
ncbi:Nucleophosmin, partial [Microtus ochrogaster]